jgi:hypothetical protein
MDDASNSRTGNEPDEKQSCLPERFSKLAIAVLLLVLSLGLIVLGLTIVPVIGFVLAIPLLAFSFFFFRAHVNQRCQIERRR